MKSASGSTCLDAVMQSFWMGLWIPALARVTIGCFTQSLWTSSSTVPVEGCKVEASLDTDPDGNVVRDIDSIEAGVAVESERETGSCTGSGVYWAGLIWGWSPCITDTWPFRKGCLKKILVLDCTIPGFCSRDCCLRDKNGNMVSSKRTWREI